MMKKYKYLFFDLDNTLWDFKKNAFHALRAAFNIYGITNQGCVFDDFQKVYFKINERLWDEYRKKNITKAILIQKRFEQTFAELGIKAIDPIEFNNTYLEEMPKQTVLVNGAVEVLEYLIGKGYDLNIITNGFREVQFKKLENSGLKKYFKKVFISEDIKAPKPDRRIFEHAIRSCNARKSESIMIGDSLEVDIIGAANFGIDQVYYCPDHDICHRSADYQEKNSLKTKFFRIEKLSDMIAMF